MEQVVKLISKASVVLVFLLVSVTFEEYLSFNKKFKGLYSHNLSPDSEKKRNAKSIRDNILIQIVQGLLFSLFIYMDSSTNIMAVCSHGITYDARGVVLNLSFIYGPITLTITALAAAVTRICNPTGNAVIPVFSILVAYISEMAVMYYLRKKGRKISGKGFALGAFLTGIGSGISILTMSRNGGGDTLIPAVILIIVYPLFTISAFKIIEAIKNSKSLVFELYKSDEKFNKMNEELQTRLEELRENEVHFKTMFYYSGEAIFLIKQNKIVDVNKAGMEMLGYRREEEVIGTNFASYVMELAPYEIKRELDIEEMFLRVENGETIKTELQIVTRDMANLPIEAFMIELKTPNNEYIYLSARDISVRKKHEREILYKSRYDEITNVANRNYFNEVVQKLLALPESYPVCYLMADINGLKLTNDVFGHAKGDELIVKVSAVLNTCCRSNDIVARIGGDEFAIFFTNTDENTAKSLVERINKKLDNERYDTVKPFVSLGYAVKKNIDEEIDFNEVVKRADDMMYENKSASREKNRKIFLKNMLRRLYEISPEETIRYRNLKELGVNFKKIYSMDTGVEKKVNKLISYINVGKLITPRAEWNMKGESLSTLKFSRKLLEGTAVILNIISNSENNIISTEELYMLNENWDGSGEKYGTAGDEIPLAIRIFKMIYDIYYLKTHKEIVGALTNDEIIALIRSESGKKYDPKLCECRLEEIL